MPQWPWKKARPGVDQYGRSPLWYHAANGDLDAVRQEVRSGQAATAADKDGFTSLHVAAQNGHAEVVALLIQAGADVNAVDRHGNGPLWTAGYEAAKRIATEANLSIVAMLLKAGADPHHRNRADRTPETWRNASQRVDAIFADAGLPGT